MGVLAGLEAAVEELCGTDPPAWARCLNRLEAVATRAAAAFEARQRLGEDRQPNLLDLARTPAQRRADAVVEMARRAGKYQPR